MLVLAFAFLGAGATVVDVAADGRHAADVTTLGARADIILIGRVTEVRSEWITAPRTIVTRVVVAVDETLKGAGPGASVTITQPGGQVDDVRAVVTGTPVFTRGQRVLLFLARGHDGTLHPLWMWQGVFVIEASGAGDEAIRTAPDAADAVDRLPLDRLREQIRVQRGTPDR